MSKLVMGRTKLAGDQQCKVLYHQEKDMVELEVGGTSLKLAAGHFMMINEMMRKAAAKLVMQTALHHHDADDENFSMGKASMPMTGRFLMAEQPQMSRLG